MAQFPPVPRWSQVLGDKVKTISKSWDDWFQTIQRTLDQSALVVGQVALDTQSAAIAPTTIASSLAAGLYRLSYYAQVTQAASVSSSLTPDFQWTTNGVAQTTASAALTTNTTASHQERSFPIKVDQSSAVTYSVAYASVGAPVMQYSLDIALEAVPS